MRKRKHGRSNGKRDHCDSEFRRHRSRTLKSLCHLHVGMLMAVCDTHHVTIPGVKAMKRTSRPQPSFVIARMKKPPKERHGQITDLVFRCHIHSLTVGTRDSRLSTTCFGGMSYAQIRPIPLLLAGLVGCLHRTVAEKPVVVQSPSQTYTVIVPPAGSAVICPNGLRVPYGAAC